MSSSADRTFASVFPARSTPVDPKLTAAVRAAEKELGMRVFCMIDPGTATGPDLFHPDRLEKIIEGIRTNARGEQVAILLHSPGGDANTAYRIAKLLMRHCGGYHVIIPSWAKSAATLFSLGAERILFDECAELGPLDVQVADAERERFISALEVVQSLDRLNSEAMQIVDTMMTLLLRRSGKRIDSLLPSILKYAADITRPIFEKIDTVAFTFHARLLKIGEDYAKLLLKNKYDEDDAEKIALSLTRKYPDHGFVIDWDEATEIGLDLEEIPDTIREPLRSAVVSCTRGLVVGFLETDHATKANETKIPRVPSDHPKLPSSTDKPNGSASGNGTKRRTRNRIGSDGSP